MSDVFLSYSRRNKEFVLSLSAALKERGREVWVDWQDIPPTADWMAEIRGGIEATHTFVCILSPDYIASTVCQEETEYAVRHNKRIVPIVHRDVLPSEVPAAVGAHNWIFCRESDDFEAAVETLIRALDTDWEWVRAHTRLLTRALEWEGKRRDPSFLLRGSDLRAAEEWQARTDTSGGGTRQPQPTELQVAYLAASRTAEARRQRGTVGVLSAGIVVSLILVLLAAFQTHAARKERQITQLQATKLKHLLYLSNMALANRACEEGDLPHAQEVMASFKDEPGRNIEWTFLDEMCRLRPLLMDMKEHHSYIAAMAFTSDGTRLITGGRDTVDVWSAVTGRHLAAHKRREAAARHGADSGDVRSLSPTPEGRFVLVGLASGEAYLWDTQNGRGDSPLPLHPLSVNAVGVSADGKLLLTACEDGRVRLWERGTLKFLRVLGDEKGLGREKRTGVVSAFFSPDGLRVIAADHDNRVRVWRLRDGRLLRSLSLRGHRGGINAVALSPDGERIASAGEDATVRIWDLRTGTPALPPLKHSAPVLSVCFSGDGRRVAAGARDGHVRLWQATSSSVGISLPGDTDTVSSVVFSPDGLALAVAGGKRRSDDSSDPRGDGTAFIWDTSVSRRSLVLPAGPSSLYAVLAAGTHTLISFDTDGRIKVWDRDTGSLLRAWSAPEHNFTAAAITPDGRLAATASRKGAVQVWNAASGQLERVLGQTAGEITAAALSPDGTRVAAVASDGTLIVWDVRTGKIISRIGSSSRGSVAAPLDPRRTPLAEPLFPDAPAVRSLHWSPDGRHIVASANGRDSSSVSKASIYEERGGIWTKVNEDDGREDQGTTPVASGDIADVAPEEVVHTQTVLEGRKIYAFQNSGSIWARDSRSGGKFKQIGGAAIRDATAASFSADGQRVATGGPDGVVRLFDVESRLELLTLHGHTGPVYSVTITPDGVIVSGGKDGTVRVWQRLTEVQVAHLLWARSN